MKIIKTSLTGIFRLIYFLPVLLVVSLLVLIFGHPILGPELPGSDNANFIALATWLSRWFPRIPFWFPQAGAGMSFTVSYPIFNHLLMIIFGELFNLPIAIVFRIWSLIVVVLTAIGLYLLSFRLTKNQTVAALAAIFYPLSPITWIFMMGWGFTAEQLSLVLIAPVLMMLTLFLDEYYVKGLTLRAKIYFLLLAILFTILPFAHPLVFFGILMITSILFIVYPLICYRSAKVKLGKTLMVGVTSLVIFSLLTSYWIIPFVKYQSVVAKGAPVEKAVSNRNQFLQNGIYPLNVFSIISKTATYKTYDDPPQNISAYAWHNVSFPFIISVLALIGFLGSFFINRKVFALAVANLIPLGIAIFPQVTYRFLAFPFSDYFLNWRAAIIPSRVIIPLLAGFGCYICAYLVTFPLDYLSRKIKFSVLKYSFKTMFVVTTAVLMLLIAGISLWMFKSRPNPYPSMLLSYGPENSMPGVRIELRDIWGKRGFNYCYGGEAEAFPENYPPCFNRSLQKYFWEYDLNKVCKKFEEKNETISTEISHLCSSDSDPEIVKKIALECDHGTMDIKYSEICTARLESLWSQLKPENIVLELRKSDLFGKGRDILFERDKKMLGVVPNNSNTRIDVSTPLGQFMMAIPFYSTTPELPVYYNQATLIKTLWNYEIGVFNQMEGVWPQDSIMYELSKYFGLGYAILSENLVPLDKYERTGWQRVAKVSKEEDFNEGLAAWKFKDAVGLLRATTKPLVLVIGQDKVDGYFRIFHLANLGALPFEDGLIVKGGPDVDAYTAEDLKKFDAVVLEGYAYRNQRKGWKVLDEYTKDGGALLINTGWQYSSADWQVPSAPEFLPLKELKWQEPGNFQEYTSEETAFVKDVDLKTFPPMVYMGKPWNISTSNKSNLRSWAKVILSANSKPLIAGGQYGAGKVIWLGFDLPGHIGAYGDNEEEIKLYRNLLNYLLENKEGKVLSATFKRDYPDRLEITINESSGQRTAVYWSEAYYPDFKAKLVSGGKSENLKVYKAGPGMTMFILPKVTAGSKIIYEYKTPLTVTLARIVSLATLIFLISIVVNSKILFNIKTNVFNRIVKGKLKKRIFGEHGDEDLNY